MAKKKRGGGGGGGGGGGHDAGGGLRWLLTYADMITLLLALFIYFYSISKVSETKMLEFSQAFADQFSIFQGTNNPLNGGLGVLDANETVLAREGGVKKDRGQLDLIQRAGATVKESERGLIVQITDQFLFGPGSADLIPGAEQLLGNVAFFLNDIVPDRQIRIEGHTDNVDFQSSRFPSNWELSAARAATIARVLNEDFGVNPQRLAVMGYGPFRPIAGTVETQTPGQQAENRRVEIVVIRERIK